MFKNPKENVVCKPLKPCPRSLLETTKSYAKEANMVGSRGINEPRELLAINRLIKVSL